MSNKDENAVELYRRYRPTSLRDVIGQDDAMRMLSDMGRQGTIPHYLLFSGPSGCGKTTVARILRVKLGCSDLDFIERNNASFRGIDMAREIEQQVHLLPLGGKCRVYLFDECHQLGVDCQEAMLKILEDIPSHVYFILCTTNPGKLKKTMLTRATEIKFRGLPADAMGQLIDRVCAAEKIVLTPTVREKLIECAEGSARKALVYLHTIAGISDEAQRLAIITAGEHKVEAIELARLLFKKKPSWADVAKLLKTLGEDDAENIRYLILGYARSVLLSSGSDYAAHVISVFGRAFYDSKQAGLALACFDAIRGGK